MKKIMLILTIVVIGVLMASPAWALKVHGGWNVSSEGCADCHTTHAANAAFLLSAGPTQTDACYYCHGVGAAASQYDVKNGATTGDFDYNKVPRAEWDGTGPFGSNEVRPSYSGGFVMSYDFENQADGGQDDAYTGFVASDSTHNVETVAIGDAGYNQSAWNNASNIPGGSAAIVGNTFKCGSCHDPHGVDSDDTDGAGAITANPRLLRHTLPAVSGASNNVTITVDAATYRSVSYGSNVNNWCGGCHNYFAAADNSGHSNAVGGAGLGHNPSGKYRHPMGIAVNTTTAYVSGASFASLGKGTPVSSDGSKLMCFSCHRAHGTASGNTSAISNRWNKYDGTTGYGSALLRLKNRDTCYNCHGGAQSNPYQP